MSTKLKTIKVYGSLAKFLGKKEFKADIASAADAMKFLLVNFPALEDNMKDQYYKVKVGDYDLEEKELVDPSGNQEIKIIPLVGGAIFGWIKDVFSSTVGKIIAGAVLIAAPYMAPAFFWRKYWCIWCNYYGCNCYENCWSYVGIKWCF